MSQDTLQLTATQFRDSPEQAYRAADRGQSVEIKNDRYKDRIFELTARNKAHIKESEDEQI